MSPTRRRTSVVTAIALAASFGAFACFSSDRIAIPDARGIRSGSSALHDDISTGFINACKKGGAPGTYHFHLDVQGGGDLTDVGGRDVTVDFDGTSLACQTMVVPSNPASWNGVTATVTVTETQIPAGMQVDSIEVYSSLTGVFDPTLTGTVSATKQFHYGDMLWVKYFNSPGGPVCTDPAATNAGGPLPCQYPPTPCPDGSFTYSFNLAGDLIIKYDQFPAPNDNSYGVNAVGWGSHGHKFSDLVGSDHAGFQLLDGSNTVKLSFNVDYLSAVSTAPSGYASLGVTGGDGKMLVGTATGITATSSLANNLNNINIPGLFNASHVQQFGSVNLLIDSPPTDAAHTTYNISDPTLAGWDFHDTYYVTISAAKLASIGFNAATWKVLPNADQLHNSPAKACPATGGGACDLTATKYVVTGKQVQITIANGATTDAILTQLALTWPTTNGKLMQVKLDGDVVYDNPDISGGSALLTLAQLVADQNKRKINHGSSDVLTLIFENNADTNLAHYTSTLDFGNCSIAILPN